MTSPRMPATDAIRKLNALPADTDEEWAHREAEEIVMRFLREIGCGEVSDAFKSARDRVGFWYS